jgi:hypothetical protein
MKKSKLANSAGGRSRGKPDSLALTPALVPAPNEKQKSSDQSAVYIADGLELEENEAIARIEELLDYLIDDTAATAAAEVIITILFLFF